MTAYVAPGLHLILDFHGCRNLDDQAAIGDTLRRAASACGATLLGLHLHHFGENAGVTGLALLAESHISIHTWPETGFAAVDIFMCGHCDPRAALPVLEERFRPTRTVMTEIRRGDAP